MRQKSGSCYTSRDRPARCFRLYDPFTTRASQLGTNLADHFEADRFDFQHLRNIFANFVPGTRSPTIMTKAESRKTDGRRGDLRKCPRATHREPGFRK